MDKSLPKLMAIIKNPIVLALTLGGTLTILLTTLLLDLSYERASSRFERAANVQIRAIQNGVNTGTQSLRSVNQLFSTVNKVNRQQFSQFTRPLLNNHSYIDKFGYSELVTKENLLNFEKEMLSETPYFHTQDLSKANLKKVADADYVITKFVEPSISNETQLGTDNLAEELNAVVLNQARHSGKPTITKGFVVANKLQSQKAVIMWMPMYKSGVMPSTLKERHGALIGFTSATFRMDDLVLSTLHDSGLADTSQLSVQILDADNTDFLLFGDQSTSVTNKWKLHPLLKLENTLEVGNRLWKIKISPTDTSSFFDDSLAWETFIAGIVISALMGAFMRGRQSLVDQQQQEAAASRRAFEQQLELNTLQKESTRLTNIIDTQYEIARADFDLTAFMNLVAERVLRVTSGNGAVIQMLENEKLVYVASAGSLLPFIGAKRNPEDCLSGYCIDSQSALVSVDTNQDSRVNLEVCREIRSNSMLVAPMLHSGKVVGVLMVISQKTNAFDSRDTQSLQLLANVTASALLQRQSYETKAGLLKELQLTAEDLFEQKELAQVTLRAIGDAVITTDIASNVTYLNPIAENLTGWKNENAIGRPITEVFNIINELTRDPVMNPVHAALLDRQIVSMEANAVLIGKKGGEYAIDDSAAPIFNRAGDAIGAVLVFRDVSNERTLSNEISYQAKHDALTGLLNRREFNNRIEQSLAQYHSTGKSSTLLYLDLDQFKIVNDTCGHAAGDDLLMQVTKLLEANLRDNDVVARLGGDEFGILLINCPQENAVNVAENIRKDIEALKFPWENKIFQIGVSIGLVNYAVENFDLKRLLSAADGACYVAKEKGRNQVCIFEPNAIEQTLRSSQMNWVVRIQKTLEENRFVLYAQPIVSASAQKPELKHYEILLRMLNTDDEIVPPMAFIPAAERYNLMETIDRWVIREAFNFIKTRNDVMLSINLSGQSISEPRFYEYVKKELASTNIDATRICFEITETAAIANLNQATSFMSSLKKLGFTFALDDFGSGMSSFRYLRYLPVDYLKIDGDFVKKIATDKIDKAMVESINTVARIMGIKTIAEFVENDAILNVLIALGVDYAQGYGIGKPIPLTQI